MQVKINPLISWVWVGFVLTIVGTSLAGWPRTAACRGFGVHQGLGQGQGQRQIEEAVGGSELGDSCTDIAVEVRDLTRTFGVRKALDSVELRVAARRVLVGVRPQRRGQDDARAHPDHAVGPVERRRSRYAASM